jgi:IQ calmodulin-binding motif
MNLHLHHHRKLSEILPIPEGLRELMADITREVLRFQPHNIEAFIADYLESMLLTRELYQIASQTVEDVVDSSFQIVELLQKNGISEQLAESAVNVIKEEFKSHFAEMDEDEPLKELNIINRLIEECKLTVDQAHKASEVIESAWVHYYQRNKNDFAKIGPDFTHHDAVKKTLMVYQKSKTVNNSALNKSGKVLDAGFQGYFKQKFHENVAQGHIGKGNLFANWHKPNFQKREHAAIKIQSWFRAQKSRRDFKEMVKAAKLIQAEFKKYTNRKGLKRIELSCDSEEMKHQKKIVMKPELGDSSEELKRRQEAAMKIQTCYRSYQIRKRLQHKSAAIIQVHFRGFMTRKNRQQMN